MRVSRGLEIEAGVKPVAKPPQSADRGQMRRDGGRHELRHASRPKHKMDSQKEYIVHPMLRTSYNLSRNLLLELEVRKRWTVRESVQDQANESDLLRRAGRRYDFHSSPLTTAAIFK